MQIAYHTPDNPFYHNEEIKKAVLLGVNFWAEKNFYCEWNGWHNDIGVGLKLPDILLLGVEGIDPTVEQKLMDKLMKSDMENGQKFKFIKEREVDPSGGNLTDNIMSSMKLAVIKKDGNKLMWLRSLLERELKPVPTYKWTMHRHDADGIKEDMSNFQHWHLLYFGGYGEVFVNGVNRYITYTDGTQYALPKEALDDYAKYILDGQQFAFRNEYREWNASGRGAVRPDSLKGIYSGVEKATELLLEHEEINRFDELQTMYTRRFEGETDGGANGHRFYYEADYQIMNNQNYMAAVRHASNRSRIFEVLNDENPLGYYTGLGGTFYYVNGDEYFNIPPLYDWNKIPGTTTRQGFLPTPDQNKSYNQKGNTNHTAGVSNGQIGASYIDLNKHGVKSKQAYFMFQDAVVCLGSDITSAKPEEIVSAINQTKLGEEVLVGTAGGRTKLENNTQQTGIYSYVYNNGISYITDAKVHVDLAHKDGDWKTINTRMESTLASSDVFSIYLSHGQKPKKASYAYTALMNTTPDATEEYLASPTYVTLQNDKNIQAVYDSKNDVAQAVFYKAGKLELPNGKTISASRACVCIIENVKGETKVTIASNDFKEHKATIQINDVAQKVTITKKSVFYTF